MLKLAEKFCVHTRPRFDHCYRESVGLPSAYRTLRLLCHQVCRFRENKFERIRRTTGRQQARSSPEFIELPRRSPGARTEGRARGERPGAHAEARAERRRNVAEKIAATGTAAVIGSGSSDIGAEPVTAGFALRIDALHRKAGQIFHFLSILGAAPDASASRRQVEKVLSSPWASKSWWKKHLENPSQKKCSGQASLMAGIVP